MRPVIWLLSRSTNAVVRLLGGDPQAAGEQLSAEELREIVSSHEDLEDDERRILGDVLAAGETTLKEVMRPRADVAFLRADLGLREAEELFGEPLLETDAGRITDRALQGADVAERKDRRRSAARVVHRVPRGEQPGQDREEDRPDERRDPQRTTEAVQLLGCEAADGHAHTLPLRRALRVRRSRSSGGRTRTYDTRIMSPLL